jgi:parvulin-like peptidyl-prolyl isomerase
VSYESYLFELRHLTHYYETQQESDFGGKDKGQLEAFKQRSLQQVIDDAYIKQLARENGVSVSNAEVDDAVGLLRQQNRLGNSDQEFSDVLQEFWGWSIDDFRRELRQQLLTQKVVSKLDTATADRARQAEARLQGGFEFAKLAAEVSDDQATKASGGEYGFLVDRGNRELSPQVVDTLFKLQPNQTSGIIDTGYSLEIVRVLSATNDKLRAAHISFNYQPAVTFIKPVSDKNPPSRYINVQPPAEQQVSQQLGR